MELRAEERDVLDTLRKELRRRIAEAGPRVTKKGIFDDLGIQEQTFDAGFRRGSIKLAMILRVLGHLDIDAGEFFSTALLPDVTRLLGKPQGDPPLAVKLGRDRLEKEGWP